MQRYTYPYVYIHIHTYIYIHTYTYIYIRIHICISCSNVFHCRVTSLLVTPSCRCWYTWTTCTRSQSWRSLSSSRHYPKSSPTIPRCVRAYVRMYVCMSGFLCMYVHIVRNDSLPCYTTLTLKLSCMYCTYSMFVYHVLLICTYVCMYIQCAYAHVLIHAWHWDPV